MPILLFGLQGIWAEKTKLFGNLEVGFCPFCYCWCWNSRRQRSEGSVKEVSICLETLYLDGA